MMSNDNRQRWTGRSGQAIMLFALAFGLMAGVLGLVLDGGRIYYERNRVQMAADAGAIAGVQELRRGNVIQVDDPVVIDDIELNGFSTSNSTISVNPNVSGYSPGTAVEVNISYNVPTTFMRIFGAEYSTINARAVASKERAGDPCIIVLDPLGQDAFKTNGNPTLDTNCGIVVNSNYPNYAARNTGTGTVKATWVGVVGGWDGIFTPTPKSGITRMIDPLEDIPEPSEPPAAPAESKVTLPNGQKQTTFYPGTYNSKLQFTNGGENAIFSPGLYYLKQGMQITGGNVSGAGVTFFNADISGQKAIDISTQQTDTIQLSAPTTDITYVDKNLALKTLDRGILFWYTRSAVYINNGSKIARGSAESYYSGGFYFPTTHLDWAGSPDVQNVSHWTMIIAYTLNISGDASVQVYKVYKPEKDQAPPSYAAVMYE